MIISTVWRTHRNIWWHELGAFFPAHSVSIFHRMIPVFSARIIWIYHLMAGVYGVVGWNAKIFLLKEKLARSITKLHGMRRRNELYEFVLLCFVHGNLGRMCGLAFCWCDMYRTWSVETIFHTNLRWFSLNQEVKMKNWSKWAGLNVTSKHAVWIPCRIQIGSPFRIKLREKNNPNRHMPTTTTSW